MSSVILVIILLSTIYSGKAAVEFDAVLLDCEKESSNYDIKSPPFHKIDNCTRKISITLNITNIGKTTREEIFTLIHHITDPVNGAKMYLLNPLVVRLRQEQVLLAYPFRYLSAVNARAKEFIINHESQKNFTGCDDTSMINPTCGLKYEKGRAVQYSEGFCCTCPQQPVNEKQPRGGQDCSLDVKGDPSDREKRKYKESAHCLEFNDIWYSVCALNEPFILHETFLHVYIEKLFKDGSSGWFSLTHDEEFALSPQNTYQYDDNKTIVISYITDNPAEKGVTLPSDRRLLIPLPTASEYLSKVPTPIKKGATDYILLPKDIIDPEGDVCDTAGVSYKAFVLQTNRCNESKNTCLKNQPLDFWEEDNEKRARGVKGNYLLENFGIPYKDPIIGDKETKEQWLVLEYHDQHRTFLFVEINADEITIIPIGKYAQISKIVSSTGNKTINIFVSVLNADLMPAKFTIGAVNCGYGVPDSTNESVTIPPQMTKEVLIATKQGSTLLNEKFECTVQVSSESYGVVAKRKVVIDPRSRCFCRLHCECACMRDSLDCKLMSEKDYQTAGFRGSLPVLTAQPPYRMWFVAHPFLAVLAVFVVMMLIGLVKAIFGLLGCRIIGEFGMDKVLYRRGEIKNYNEPELKNLQPIYDDDGYPIHPDTRKRIKVIGNLLLAFYNVMFLFFWPCLMCRKCYAKVKKEFFKENGGYINISKDEEMKSSKGNPFKQLMAKFNKETSSERKREEPSKERQLDGEASSKKEMENLSKEISSERKNGEPVRETSSKREMEILSKETSSERKAGKLSKETTSSSDGKVEKTHKDIAERKMGQNDKHSTRKNNKEDERKLEKIPSGPTIDTLTKEQKHWQEAKKRVDATTFPKKNFFTKD